MGVMRSEYSIAMLNIPKQNHCYLITGNFRKISWYWEDTDSIQFL